MSEVSCNNCRAACCLADTAMPLARDELIFMQKAGTEIEELSPPPEPKPDNDPVTELLKVLGGSGIVVSTRPSEPRGMYLLKEDCGYLDKTGDFPKCGAYEDPGRPQVCQRFRSGSSACLDVRLIRGVDSPAA